MLTYRETQLQLRCFCYVPPMQLDTRWTASKVAEALVRAYRLMPGRPVMSGYGGRFAVQSDAGDIVIEPFSWPERFVDDPQHRRVLMTWARCMAIGESVRDRYDQLQWPRSSSERRRAAALNAIARGLNREATETGS